MMSGEGYEVIGLQSPHRQRRGRVRGGAKGELGGGEGGGGR